MKKSILIISLLFASSLAGYSPISKKITIVESKEINPYLKLYQAVCKVESDNNPLAYNAEEMATGIVQIRPIRLKDYTQRTGEILSLSACYDTIISKRIFLYYASKFQPYEQERIARLWNGSGVKTVQYWNKVKKYL